jgi:hypothetical protein
MPVKEALVLKLAAEGAGVCIYRTISETGALQFHAKGCSMRLDEMNDEVWDEWTMAPVATIEEALRSIYGDSGWIYWHPVTALSEYRAVIWKCVEEASHSVANDPPEMWHRSRLKWLAICSAD